MKGSCSRTPSLLLCMTLKYPLNQSVVYTTESVIYLTQVRESSLPVLSLSHLQGPFLLLAAGGGLATLTLLGERLLQSDTTSP